jgi:hypothetical protein
VSDFTFQTQVSLKRPIKFFVEVKLNEVPVLDARVKVHVEVINLSGQKTDGVWIDLLDNGNGGIVFPVFVNITHTEGI